MSDPVHHRADRPDEPAEDLARTLPNPPPPRPAPRAAAIAMALERFDAGATHPPAPRQASASRLAWRWQPGRAQLAAFVSIAFVALFAVPLALDHPDGRIASPPSSSVPRTVDAAPAGSNRSAAPERTTASQSAPRLSQGARLAAAPVPERSNGPDTSGTPVREVELASAVPIPVAAPPPPPPAPAPALPATSVATEALADVSGAVQRASRAEDGASDIVVTGSRISRRATAAARRGDWNACTVADPEQSLRGCRGLVRAGAKGAAGAAGGQVAQGLALGWQEDWSGAVAAFDRAIALRPRWGLAYLNRGLANERLGQSDRAAADLDLAVRYDPSARSYYARSQARRARGDLRGAQADEDRAIDMDPAYVRIIRD